MPSKRWIRGAERSEQRAAYAAGPSAAQIVRSIFHAAEATYAAGMALQNFPHWVGQWWTK